jgi:hypothetical protein
MYKVLPAIIIALLSTDFCFSQRAGGLPLVENGDLPGLKISSSRMFNGTSLFGYIDGGAELYLEYGFDIVSVTESEYLGGKFKTEIYRMKGPEEAYGIFSISKFRCLGNPPVSSFTCHTRYQLQVCKGPFYINIINRTGSSSDSIASLDIARIVTKKINEKDAELSSYLPGITVENLNRDCYLVKGRLGIVNGVPELEDFFRGITDFTALIRNEDKKKTISVRFNNRNSYTSFLELHQIDEKKITGEPGGWNYGTVTKMAENHLIIELVNN